MENAFVIGLIDVLAMRVTCGGGVVPSGLRVSPEQQQAPSMLPPHLSALGASANDIGIFSLLYSLSYCQNIALSIVLEVPPSE